MKLSDFFKGIFGSHVQKIDDGVKSVKEASDKKDLNGIFTSVGDIVEGAAKIVESVSNGLKEAGNPAITGPEKHEAVKTFVVDTLEEPVKEALPSPLGNLARSLLGIVANVLIQYTVQRLNKNGWNL